MQTETLDVRPYQLLCVICRSGAGWPAEPRRERLLRILGQVREDRGRPMRLRCHADSGYAYQNPGRGEDTPEGELFNEKRDLDVLQRLGLVPGSTRPALELFERVFERIRTTQGICGFEEVTAAPWQGCPEAASGAYERAIAAGLHQILPARDPGEKASYKQESVAALRRAERLQIRPHHLMCMACFHGGRDRIEPIEEDNLFEAIDVIQRRPETPVTLVRGCCMICPPCSRFDPRRGQCVGGKGMNLRDQKKDLDVLQRLGLAYGDTLPARRLYALLFERIPSTRLVCSYGDGVARSVEWSICSAPESERYRQARDAFLGMPAGGPATCP